MLEPSFSNAVPSNAVDSVTFNTDDNKITISVSGKEQIISTIRMINISIFPPQYPDIEPIVKPMINTIILAKKPTTSEILVPYTTLMK